MPFVKHDSSQIHSSSFDPVENVAHFRFHCHACGRTGVKDGVPCQKCRGAGHATYRYENVEPHVYAAVRDAESVGRAFAQHIKANPDRYPYKRL